MIGRLWVLVEHGIGCVGSERKKYRGHNMILCGIGSRMGEI